MALYDDVLAVSREYLGPAAERFLSRQISERLDLPSKEDLAAHHMEELAKWCQSSGSLYLDDAKAAEYASKVKRLK
jgi:hypothetical protein